MLALGLAAAVALGVVAVVTLVDGSEQSRDARSGITVVFAVGDGADGAPEPVRLARYIASQKPDRFFYLGDVYERGTAAEFSSYYDAMYGALASRTDPVIGNHEYRKRRAGYNAYWRRKRGWTTERARHRAYVDRASGWQIVAYSSEHDSDAEARWVGRQVRRHGGTCRIVMAHKGRHVVADGLHSDIRAQEPVWQRIAGRTAINLVAHNHLYGRLAPLRGTHVIVSGAGGHDLRPLGRQHHRVAASRTGVPTATRLRLRRGAADVRQVTADGDVVDTRTIRCDPAD